MKWNYPRWERVDDVLVSLDLGPGYWLSFECWQCCHDDFPCYDLERGDLVEVILYWGEDLLQALGLVDEFLNHSCSNEQSRILRGLVLELVHRTLVANPELREGFWEEWGCS